MSVYCLTSLGLEKEEYYKIGKTSKTLIELKKQYSRYLPQVNIIKFELVCDYSQVEKDLHLKLDKYRVNKSEWFKTNIRNITKAFKEIANKKDEISELTSKLNTFKLNNISQFISVKKLKEYCKEMGVKGYTNFRKADIIDFLTKDQLIFILNKENIRFNVKSDLSKLKNYIK